MAVDLSKKFVVPPLELLAPPMDLSKKFVEPPWLEIDTLLPALAWCENMIVPAFLVKKFCVRPELLKQELS